MKPFIFCVTVNCAKVTAVMLESFHKHHPNDVIAIVGTTQDFCELNFHKNNWFIDIGDNSILMDLFSRGHAGTAAVFSMVIQNKFKIDDYDSFIHIDSDIYFKKESISIIENHFDEGYDIAGTRRCFKNNPSGIKGLDAFPDTVSTFFFGMKLEKIPKFSFEDLCHICEGALHPIEGWVALDFFDGLTHATMQNGGTVKFLDQNEFGSQDSYGKKENNYKSNMHMDCGSHLIHFGGVGSGYAYATGKSNPQEGYAKWALSKWAMFAKLFYNETTDYSEPTVYGEDGRWINGGYDETIMKQLLIDLKS